MEQGKTNAVAILSDEAKPKIVIWLQAPFFFFNKKRIMMMIYTNENSYQNAIERNRFNLLVT